jgi:hypothetical protein
MALGFKIAAATYDRGLPEYGGVEKHDKVVTIVKTGLSGTDVVIEYVQNRSL